VIVLRVKIIDYDKERNTCKSQLLSGDIVELDPYVGCAIDLSDEDYEAGKGADIVGKDFILTEYTVYSHNVVPFKGGMIAV
jgi:hypothetical protein